MNKKQLTHKDFVQKEKIEVKLGDLISSYEALLQLSRMNFTVSTGFKIALAYKNVYREVEAFENLKDQLRKEYATEEKLENGQKKYNFGDNDKKVEGIIKDKMMEVVTLNVAYLYSKDFEGKELQPSIIADLDWLILE